MPTATHVLSAMILADNMQNFNSLVSSGDLSTVSRLGRRHNVIKGCLTSLSFLIDPFGNVVSYQLAQVLRVFRDEDFDLFAGGWSARGCHISVHHDKSFLPVSSKCCAALQDGMSLLENPKSGRIALHPIVLCKVQSIPPIRLQF